MPDTGSDSAALIAAPELKPVILATARLAQAASDTRRRNTE